MLRPTPAEWNKTEVFREVVHGDAAGIAELMEEANRQPPDTRTVIRFIGPVVPTDLSAQIDMLSGGLETLFSSNGRCKSGVVQCLLAAEKTSRHDSHTFIPVHD